MLHMDVFGYQSLFVCVCVRVQFFPLNSLRLVWPPMDALLGFSLIISLTDVKAKKKETEMKKREGRREGND